MLQAKDLRIGNYVESYNTNGNPMEWVLWRIDSAWQLQEVEELEGKEGWFRPIPLSEDWLLRAGFKKQGRLLTLQIDPDIEFQYCIDNSSILLTVNISGLDDSNNYQLVQPCIPNSGCVHNLQNIYYTWKGEELTIKENQ